MKNGVVFDEYIKNIEHECQDLFILAKKLRAEKNAAGKKAAPPARQQSPILAEMIQRQRTQQSPKPNTALDTSDV